LESLRFGDTFAYIATSNMAKHALVQGLLCCSKYFMDESLHTERNIHCLLNSGIKLELNIIYSIFDHMAFKYFSVVTLPFITIKPSILIETIRRRISHVKGMVSVVMSKETLTPKGQ
jgi:hypothetical protein